MGKLSRDKGKVGEREVADILKTHGFTGARRGVQYSGGPDSPDVIGLPHVHLEVKRTERFNLYGALTQAKEESAKGETPVVVHRSSRREWVAVLAFEDYIALYKAAHGIDVQF